MAETQRAPEAPLARGAPRSERVNDWIAGHFGVVATAMTMWFALAAWHLAIPHSLVSANGHLIDPSTTDPRGYNVYSYKSLAYSDIFRLYAERGLWGHPVPYVQARIEYPVITGIFMWIASFFPGVNDYFVASAVGLWLAGLVGLYALRKLVPGTYWWLAFTPLLFVFSLLNWDVLGICFLVLGLWMVGQKRFTAAGIAFALGTCAKLFPIVYVPFILARLVREHRENPDLRRFVVSFVGTCVAVNLPFAIAGFHNWAFFFSFNATRGAAGIIATFGNHVALQDAVIAVAVLASIAVGLRLVLRGGSPERAAAYTFVVFLVINKVYSPQYTLWLLVMALIAEWPIWTILLLTMVGLADYYGTFATLFITNASVPHSSVTTWWEQMVAPWVGRALYLGVVASAVGAAVFGRGPSAASSPVAGARMPQRGDDDLVALASSPPG